MRNSNPIIEKLKGFERDGKNVDFFIPENILNTNERNLVFEFTDGSSVRLPFRGSFTVARRLLKEAYAQFER